MLKKKEKKWKTYFQICRAAVHELGNRNKNEMGKGESSEHIQF
jgi:hypothetical protein